MPCRSHRLAALGFALLLSGCTTIRPVPFTEPPQPPQPVFSHELLGQVLHRFVDTEGRVDYLALRDSVKDLEHYYLLLATYSPDSHPPLFPTSDHRLAYWINAYNAATLKAVLHHYPIASVMDVETPAPLFFLPQGSGFFALQRLIFGATAISLYDVENDIVRPRFAEPRVHFALNCASAGCPRLPNRAFSAANLDTELERETRNFLSEGRNFHIDHAEKTISLSSIFQWYEEDFLNWYREEFAGQQATLLKYVALYLPPRRAAELRRSEATYRLQFTPYDWRLNDQHPLPVPPADAR